MRGVAHSGEKEMGDKLRMSARFESLWKDASRQAVRERGAAFLEMASSNISLQLTPQVVFSLVGVSSLGFASRW